MYLKTRKAGTFAPRKNALNSLGVSIILEIIPIQMAPNKIKGVAGMAAPKEKEKPQQTSAPS